MRWMAGTALVFVAGAAQAVDLPLPDTATLLQQDDSDAGSYALPSGPAVQGGLPSQLIDGAISRRAWRIADSAPQTLPLFQTLEASLLAQGYVVVFSCETGTCGGFDFRRATEVMPAPAMFVDLGDFRFLSARRPDEAVSILVSKSVGALHVQVITARETPLPPPSTVQGTADGLADALDADGRAVLDGVDFASGSTAAIGGDAALADLAAWLRADGARRVVIVGHTDATGALAANQAVSTARAAAVRQRLIEENGVNPAQLDAAGAGYLAPRASNADADGRALNRRVEVVVLPAAR